MPSKYGGFFTYVLLPSHAYWLPLGAAMACQCASPLKTSAYCVVNCSRFTLSRIVSSTSLGLGQMSLRNTGPSVPMPSGSVARSMSMRPASAYATTSGGLAR